MGAHSGTGAGYGGNTGTGGYGSSNTAGPHSSNLANKADPRVDSDLDGSRNMGAHSGTGAGYATTGTHGGNGLGQGTHNTAQGAGSHAHAGHGTHLDGPASNTAGPHSSNLLNKVDPRIDSDRDGSKTVGGNPQY